MVSDRAVRMAAPAMPGHDFNQDIQECGEVPIVVKDCLLPVAAASHVIKRPGYSMRKGRAMIGRYNGSGVERLIDLTPWLCVLFYEQRLRKILRGCSTSDTLPR